MRWSRHFNFSRRKVYNLDTCGYGWVVRVREKQGGLVVSGGNSEYWIWSKVQFHFGTKSTCRSDYWSMYTLFSNLLNCWTEKGYLQPYGPLLDGCGHVTRAVNTNQKNVLGDDFWLVDMQDRWKVKNRNAVCSASWWWWASFSYLTCCSKYFVW